MYKWQVLLFQQKQFELHSLKYGQWRDEQSGVMQVVSGPIGNERVHYEAPSYERVDAEMKNFISFGI